MFHMFISLSLSITMTVFSLPVSSDDKLSPQLKDKGYQPVNQIKRTINNLGKITNTEIIYSQTLEARSLMDNQFKDEWRAKLSEIRRHKDFFNSTPKSDLFAISDYEDKYGIFKEQIMSKNLKQHKKHFYNDWRISTLSKINKCRSNQLLLLSVKEGKIYNQCHDLNKSEKTVVITDVQPASRVKVFKLPQKVKLQIKLTPISKSNQQALLTSIKEAGYQGLTTTGTGVRYTQTPEANQYISLELGRAWSDHKNKMQKHQSFFKDVDPFDEAAITAYENKHDITEVETLFFRPTDQISTLFEAQWRDTNIKNCEPPKIGFISIEKGNKKIICKFEKGISELNPLTDKTELIAPKIQNQNTKNAQTQTQTQKLNVINEEVQKHVRSIVQEHKVEPESVVNNEAQDSSKKSPQNNQQLSTHLPQKVEISKAAITNDSTDKKQINEPSLESTELKECTDEVLEEIKKLLAKDKRNIISDQFQLTSMKLALQVLKNDETKHLESYEAFINKRREHLKKSDTDDIRGQLKKIYLENGLSDQLNSIDTKATKKFNYFNKSTRISNEEVSHFILLDQIADRKSQFNKMDSAIAWLSGKINSQYTRGSKNSNLTLLGHYIYQQLGGKLKREDKELKKEKLNFFMNRISNRINHSIMQIGEQLKSNENKCVQSFLEAGCFKGSGLNDFIAQSLNKSISNLQRNSQYQKMLEESLRKSLLFK